MHQLLQNVKDGFTTQAIIENDPGFAFQGRDIDAFRETICFEQYRTENRNVQVHYIYGDSGIGKTRGIYARHPAMEICRITDYGGRNGVRFDVLSQIILDSTTAADKIPKDARGRFLLRDGTVFQAYWFDDHRLSSIEGST